MKTNRLAKMRRHPLAILFRCLFLALLALAPTAWAATYYSQSSNSSPTTLANWNTVRAGGGSAPANFTTGGDVFVIQGTGNGGTTPHTVTVVNAGGASTNSTAWAVTGTIQVENGSTLNAGDGTTVTASATALITCGTFQIDNGGTYNLNYKQGANGSTTSIPGTTKSFGASSTVEIKWWGDGIGTSPAAMPSGISWGNLTINVATLGGSWNQSGGITTINGNFTIKATGGGANEFRLSSSTVYTLTIGGDFSLQGGIISGYSSTSMGSGCAIKLYGNFSQSAGTTFKTTSSSSGPTVDFIFDSTGGPASVGFTESGTVQWNRVNFIVGTGKTVTLNTAFPTGGSTTTASNVVNGTLLCNGFNVTGNNAFFLNPGGTLGITSASGITSTAATGNIQVVGTRTFATGANYIYSGSAASAVTGNQLPTTVNNLTINNANGVTLSGNVQVNGTMTMTAGAVTLGGNTLSYGASGTLLYNGASSQTTAAAEFPASSGPANLTITNSSGVILNFARTLTGTLTLTSGNLTTTAANLLTIGSAGGTSGGSASSYVNGPLARVYGATGSKNFPTGVSNFRQVAVNLTGISGTPTITVTPNEPSAWNGANTPASTTMFGTRDWTVNSSGGGNTASITLDGTGFSPAGAARMDVFDGTATTAYTPTFASPNYTTSGIALASGNNEVALGDFACAAPTTPTFSSVTAPGCSPVSVNWNVASGAATYDLFRKVSGGAYPASPLAAGLAVTTYSDSDITNAVTYVYQIKANAACGAFSLSADSTGVTPTTAPFITNNPASYTSYEGFAATFTVGARGDGLTYQWQVNKGAGFVNVDVGNADGTGGTTVTFTTVNATTSMNTYQYRCVVSGTCSPAATSAVATLTLGTQFRSLATGGWATNTSWQITSDGSTWVNAATGVYPGATAGHTDTVQVRAAHNITLATNATASAGALTIDATGKVSIGDQLSATDANAFLQIAGNLANNGTITAGQGNNNRIVFNGTTTWSGSGDITCGGSGKLGFTVNAGATLNLSVDVTVRSSTSQAVLTINGTLNGGTRFMRQAAASASSSASLIVGPGATVETANAGGIGGTNNTTSGLFQSPFGTVTLDPSANYIFDGTVNQTATIGNTVLPTANNMTIRNTGSGGNNTVTMGTIAISGTLYVQNGLLSFGSTTTSTAGALTFDGSTYQATGTWGNTGSGAANTDATRFAGTGYVTVSGPIAVTSATQFRSHISGNWNVAGTWEGSADGGATWSALLTGFTPGSTPGSTHKVYIQAGHVVTLTEAEACNDIHMSVGTTSSTTGGSGGKVACVTFTLSVNGQLRGYWAPVSTTPGTDQPSGSAFDPFTKTDNGGKVKIVGSGRVILAAGQWGSYNITTTPVSPGGAADWEFALTAGQAGTNLSSFRPANVLIDSGTTLDISTSIIGACGNGGQGVGTGGAGNITISNGATLISSGTGVIARRTSTASSGAIGTFANQGTLKLSGAAPMIATATNDFSGGTVEYNGGNQTLLVKDSGTTGPQTDPTNYNNVTLSGTGTKTNALNIAVNGTLTVSSGTTLDFNSKTITVAGAPALNGTLNMEVTRTGANTFTGSQLIQSAGTLTYGGALTVNNLGSAVVLGESIPLFSSSGGYGGSFSSVSFQPISAGLTASTASLAATGNLTITCNGTLAAGAAPNTNNCPGSSYSLGGSASGGGGGYTYSWTSSPAGFTSSSANPSVNPTVTTTYNLTVTDANGCTAVASVTVTVNPSPTITLGSSPSVTYGTTSASLPYTGTSGSPNQYSIVFDSAAHTAGFTDVSLTSLPASPIALTVPATAPVGTYNGTVSVQTAAGCSSSAVAFTVTVTAKSLTITANNTNKVYGQTVTFAGTEFTTAGLINSDSVTSVTLTSAGATVTATVGTYPIVPGGATGSGLGNYSVIYNNGTLTVNPAAVVLSVTSSSNPSGFNDALTFAANVTPTSASGTVQFRTNGVNFGAAATLVAGSASSTSTSSLPRGNNTIAAVYSGDSNYLAITNTLTQVVTNHPPVANTNSYTRNGLNTWKIAVTNLLSNASDVDSDTLSLAGVGVSTNGITLVVGGGYVMYYNTNIVDDQFSYTVTDGFGGTNSANITLTAGSSNGLGGQVNSFTLNGGTASMSFAGIPGYLYNVQVSTNLTDWNTIWSTNAPGGGVFQFNDSATPQPDAYYRLMWNGN